MMRAEKSVLGHCHAGREMFDGWGRKPSDVSKVLERCVRVERESPRVFLVPSSDTFVVPCEPMTTRLYVAIAGLLIPSVFVRRPPSGIAKDQEIASSSFEGQQTSRKLGRCASTTRQFLLVTATTLSKSSNRAAASRSVLARIPL